MYDCCNKLNFQVINQSTQTVKAVVRAVNGTNIEDVACQIIGACESECICVPMDMMSQSMIQLDSMLQDLIIYMYVCNAETSQWIEFDTVPVDSMTENVIRVIEVNGVVMLASSDDTDIDIGKDNSYYLQLYSMITDVMRIYVRYYFDGKYHTKKMKGVMLEQTRKIWVPKGVTEPEIKVQYWYWGWKDVLNRYAPIDKNLCFVGHYDGYKENACTEIICD